MAIKMTQFERIARDLKRQRREENGSSTGTYLAIAAMAALLVMVVIYLVLDQGKQVAESPALQTGAPDSSVSR